MESPLRYLENDEILYSKINRVCDFKTSIFIVGDINLANIDWKNYIGHDPKSRDFIELVNDNYLT